VVYGTTAPTAWSITCADTANNLLGYAVSNKYIEDNFKEEAKTEVISDYTTVLLLSVNILIGF